MNGQINACTPTRRGRSTNLKYLFFPYRSITNSSGHCTFSRVHLYHPGSHLSSNISCQPMHLLLRERLPDINHMFCRWHPTIVRCNRQIGCNETRCEKLHAIQQQCLESSPAALQWPPSANNCLDTASVENDELLYSRRSKIWHAFSDHRVVVIVTDSNLRHEIFCTSPRISNFEVEEHRGDRIQSVRICWWKI